MPESSFVKVGACYLNRTAITKITVNSHSSEWFLTVHLLDGKYTEFKYSTETDMNRDIHTLIGTVE